MPTLRPVGEVGAAERQELQPQLARHRLGVGIGQEQVDQQHVARAQARRGRRADDLGREPPLPLDRQDVGAGRVAQA
jgi:hypothetical protein